MIQRIAIVGGCGHVGLPLGLALARLGLVVTLLDTDERAVALVNRGEMPFRENAGPEALQLCLGKTLTATTNPVCLREQEAVLFVPYDGKDADVVEQYVELLSPETLLILRGTLALGTFDRIDNALFSRWGKCHLAYCPERIAQGNALEELHRLPQIISANSPQALSQTRELFSKLTSELVELSPSEAEMAKLMTNAWRYLEFAAANQFYLLCTEKGLDFHRIRDAITHSYPRASGFARAGLTGGPCLVKDTELLIAECEFPMGEAARKVHEELARRLVESLANRIELSGQKVAVLGAAFKAESDDTRGSLTPLIVDALAELGAYAIVTDPHVPGCIQLADALQEASAAILATPHEEYRGLRLSIPYVDCWRHLSP